MRPRRDADEALWADGVVDAVASVVDPVSTAAERVFVVLALV